MTNYARGSRHGMWKGGRRISNGYVEILTPDHPRANNGYVYEHVLVAEAAIGHYLDQRHPVHHADENKANNAPANLVVCEDRAYHNLLHRRLRAFQACGDANAERCRLCGGYDNQDDITVENLRNGWSSAHHRKCNAAHVRSYQAKRRAAKQAAEAAGAHAA